MRRGHRADVSWTYIRKKRMQTHAPEYAVEDYAYRLVPAAWR